MNGLIVALSTLVLFFAVATPAHAYLDPVTGSLLIQGLVAAIAAVVAGVKSVRDRVIRFVTSIFRKGR